MYKAVYATVGMLLIKLLLGSIAGVLIYVEALFNTKMQCNNVFIVSYCEQYDYELAVASSFEFKLIYIRRMHHKNFTFFNIKLYHPPIPTSLLLKCNIWFNLMHMMIGGVDS